MVAEVSRRWKVILVVHCITLSVDCDCDVLGKPDKPKVMLGTECPADGDNVVLWCTTSCNGITSYKFFRDGALISNSTDDQLLLTHTNSDSALGTYTCVIMRGQVESDLSDASVVKCEGDGAWGAWADWAACSVTCSVGTRSRQRSCDSPAPSPGGHDCPGDKYEAVSCDKKVDCPTTTKEPHTLHIKQESDACTPNPCGNGTCTKGKCDHCLPNPCKQGSCLSQASSHATWGNFNFTCVCGDRFEGPFCTLKDDPCRNDPTAVCKNGGKCKVKELPGGNDWICECPGNPVKGQAKDCSTKEVFPEGLPPKQMAMAIGFPTAFFVVAWIVYCVIECYQIGELPPLDWSPESPPLSPGHQEAGASGLSRLVQGVTEGQPSLSRKKKRNKTKRKRKQLAGNVKDRLGTQKKEPNKQTRVKQEKKLSNTDVGQPSSLKVSSDNAELETTTTTNQTKHLNTDPFVSTPEIELMFSQPVVYHAMRREALLMVDDFHSPGNSANASPRESFHSISS